MDLPLLAMLSTITMSRCHVAYSLSSPLDDLVKQARELMFRTTIYWRNTTTTQHVVSSQTVNRLVYESRYLYLGLAVLSRTLALAAVTSIFHEYWHLGRRVTMSPIEIAKAFNAPLLSHEESNASANDLVKSIDARIVRYGAVSVTVAADDADNASTQPGTVTNWDLTALCSMLLEIADVTVVRVPEQGLVFVSQSMQSLEQQSLVDHVVSNDDNTGSP